MTTHSYRLFSPVMRMFKICSPSNFQIESTILLAIVISLDLAFQVLFTL